MRWRTPCRRVRTGGLAAPRRPPSKNRTEKKRTARPAELLCRRRIRQDRMTETEATYIHTPLTTATANTLDNALSVCHTVSTTEYSTRPALAGKGRGDDGRERPEPRQSSDRPISAAARVLTLGVQRWKDACCRSHARRSAYPIEYPIGSCESERGARRRKGGSGFVIRDQVLMHDAPRGWDPTRPWGTRVYYTERLSSVIGSATETSTRVQ